MADRASDGHEGRLASTRQNRAVGRALRAARLSLGPQGSKQTAFAATLGRELGMPFTATAVSGWENGKRSVPGAVLVAAAMLAGQSLDSLLGEAGEPEVVQWAETLGLPQRIAAIEQRLRLGQPADGDDNPAGLRRQLAEVQAELDRQRRLNQTFEAQLEQLSTRLGSPATAGPGESAQQLEPALRALEGDVLAAGEQLGRPWDQGISYADLTSTPADRLQRRVGALEARVAELAGMVGAPYGGYPAAPGSSADDGRRLTWASEVITMLNEQMAEVRRRAEKFAQDSAARRRAGESAS